MPASGALGSFLEAMTRIRAQRLQEQEDKDKATSQMLSGIGEGIGGLGKSLTEGMKEQKSTALANKLGGDPNTPWQGGGKEEIELRKAMGQYDKSRGDDYYKQASFDLRQAAEQRAARGEDIQAQQRTDAANRLLSEDSKKDINDALGFELQAKDILAKMNDPSKPLSAREHSDLASKVRAIRSTAEKRNLSMAEFSIPSYLSPEDQQALQARDTAATKMMAVPIQRGWGAPSQVPGAQQFGKAQAAVEASSTIPRQTQMGPGGVPMSGQVPLGETYPALQGASPQQQQQAPATGGGQTAPAPGLKLYRDPKTGRTGWFKPPQ